MKKRLTKKAPVRKYEGGGVATAQTKEEQAKSAMDLLTMKPVTPSTPTSAVKKRADGFESDAQKEAYIKNAKAMLAKDKTVADLVKMKFGTAAGLKALGITDSKPATSNKTSAPAKTYQNKKDSAEVVVTAKNKDNKSTKPSTTAPAKTFQNKTAKSTKPTASDLKKEKLKLTSSEIRKMKQDAIESTKPKENIVKDLITPVGIATGAAAAGYGIYKGIKALKAAGSKAVMKELAKVLPQTTKKVVPTIKKVTTSASKSKDVVKQAANITKKNRAAINKTQKGGIDAILRKGEGATAKTKDVIKQATNITKKNSASINKTQKGGIDKILRKAEKGPKVKDPISKSTNTLKSNRSSINKTQKGGLDSILKKGESATKIKKK